MAKNKTPITNAMRLLQTAKIEFEPIFYEHEGEIGDNFGEEIARLTGIDPNMSFKTLVVRGESKKLMTVCIPVNSELDLKKFAMVAGEKKVEMIHVKELLGLTGYIRGGVSPVGMKKKYPTYIDASAGQFERIGISGGQCGVKLMLSPDDLIKMCDAKLCDIKKDK